MSPSLPWNRRVSALGAHLLCPVGPEGAYGQSSGGLSLQIWSPQGSENVEKAAVRGADRESLRFFYPVPPG
jgi:hypothetical protein